MKGGEIMQYKPFKLGVTLYVFHVERYTYKYILEDMLEIVSTQLGRGQGIEIVSPIHDRSLLYLSNEIEQRFRNAFDKYEVIPSCYSGCPGPRRVGWRYSTDEEQFDYMKLQLDTAKKLGFSVVRAAVRPRLIPRFAKYCEKIGVKLGLEIHDSYMTENQLETIEIIKSAGSDKVGIIPDCEVFCPKPSDLYSKPFIEQGSVTMAIEKGGYYEHSNLQIIKEIMPYIVHVHGRFFNINDGDEEAVRLAGAVETLQESGYEGFMSSEYEGHHRYPDNGTIEQIRHHQRLVRSYMK
jgi:sugar phosphate isomerase/epimerase